jgi:FAD/FMN-containing dehydrogenase
MSQHLNPAVIGEFRTIVGAAGLADTPEALAGFLAEWRGLYRGSATIALMPASTAEAAALVAICAREGIAVVPQGGNTGLVGGAVARSSPERPEVILSARRLRAVRAIDSDNDTITAESGCVLSELQGAAAAVDRLFPLSLAAEGSCQLGGNLSTNAGGTNVLRYGNTRNLVLGIEVVLADGRVYDGLRALRKDNTGYALRELFLGAEGTLGFITAATCRLFPRPRGVATAFVAVADPEAAVALHAAARRQLGEVLTAFELMSRYALELVLTAKPDARDPLDRPAPWYVLLETGGAETQTAAEQRLESFLDGQIQSDRVMDGVSCRSSSQRDALWSLRHEVSDAQRLAGASIKNDVAVPISAVPALIREGTDLVTRLVPGTRVVAFGHVGDGNIHFNLSKPPDMSDSRFLAQWEPLTVAVNDLVAKLGGTFSAEHGIGLLKTAELARFRGGVEIELMRRVKRALDPANLMNPGKLFGD